MRIDASSLFVRVIVGVGAFILVPQASPQTLRQASRIVRIPYTVDTVVNVYRVDGSPRAEVYRTSFIHNGNEIVLSSTLPDDPFRTAIRRALDTVGFVWFNLRLPFRASAEQAEHVAAVNRVNHGCAEENVIGRETVLNYRTVVIQRVGQERMTMWLAPDLECFALKFTLEERRADGSFAPHIEKHALKVTTNLSEL